MNAAARKRLTADIFYAALKAVDPYESAKLYARKIHSLYHVGNFNRLFVIGFGKASHLMAKAMEDGLNGLIDDGVIVTKYGHVESSAIIRQLSSVSGGISYYEAGHPLPDNNGLKGTDEIIRFLKSADEKVIVVCLISGGGSALLVSPLKGITLFEKQEITNLLLKAGADIHELNTVRKHISCVKGGRLAEIAYPAKVISLILSDVIGDRLDVIASGPTSPDKTTFSDALRVLEKYMLTGKSPKSIIDILRNGEKGLIPETPKERGEIFNKVENIIIGSNALALSAAKQKAEELGIRTEIISSDISGEARDIGKWLAQKAKEEKGSEGHPPEADRGSRCLISGGETTVTVKGHGIGGRNMEIALSFAIEMEGIAGITLLSAGTDGTDGQTDAAGAIVDGETVKKAKAMGLDPVEYLNNNNSYNFFKNAGGLFITGPTGTNVMDIQIVVIE